MADTELNVDSIISRLLEGAYLTNAEFDGEIYEIYNKRTDCFFCFVLPFIQLCDRCQWEDVGRVNRFRWQKLKFADCVSSREKSSCSSQFYSNSKLRWKSAVLLHWPRPDLSLVFRFGSTCVSSHCRRHSRPVYRLAAAVRIRRLPSRGKLSVPGRLCRPWQAVTGNHLPFTRIQD